MPDEELSVLATNSITKPENHVPANQHFLYASLEPPNLITVPQYSTNDMRPSKLLAASADKVDAGIGDFGETDTRSQRGHLQGKA